MYLTQERREELKRRIKQGEKPSILTAEFGVTRQAISSHKINMRKQEERGGVRLKLGAPRKPRLNDEQEHELNHAIGHMSPGDAGLPAKYKRWNEAAMRAFAKMKYGINPPATQVSRLLKLWEGFLDDDTLDDYYEYLKSDRAKEIARRQEDQKREFEAKYGPTGPVRKVGAPRKHPLPSEGDAEEERMPSMEEMMASLEEMRRRAASPPVTKPADQAGKHARPTRHHKPKRRR